MSVRYRVYLETQYIDGGETINVTREWFVTTPQQAIDAVHELRGLWGWGAVVGWEVAP